MERAERKKESRRNRKKRLLCVLVFLLLELAVLGRLLKDTKNSFLSLAHEQADATAEICADTMERTIVHAAQTAQILAWSVVTADGDTSFFEEEARELYTSHEPVRSIQLAPDGVVTDIYPVSGNEKGKIDLLNDPQRGPICRYGMENHVTTVQGPFELKQSGEGLAIRTPVYLQDDSFWGFAIVIVDAGDLINGTLEKISDGSYSYRFEKTDPLSDTFTAISASEETLNDPETAEFSCGQCRWRLSLEPSGGWQSGTLYTALAWAGLLIVFLLAFLFDQVLISMDRRKELAETAHHDYLTGLLNREGFDGAMREYSQAAPDEPFVGIMLDIDAFKQVNDLYGHEAGDAALEKAGERLTKIFAHQSIIGRYGGDEFCVILKGKTLEDVKDKLPALLEEKVAYPCEEGEKYFTFSAGYASYPESTEDRGSVLDLADDALYAGKLGGRNICCRYEHTLARLSRKKLGLTMDQLEQDMPIAAVLCRYDESLKVLRCSSVLLRQLGYADDYPAFSAAMHQSLKGFMQEEDCKSLLAGTFENGSRTVIRGNNGIVKQPRVYWRTSLNEAHGKIVMLFFAD